MADQESTKDTLTESESIIAQYTQVMASSSMPSLLCDTKGKINFANEAVKSLLGKYLQNVRSSLSDFNLATIESYNVNAFIKPQSFGGSTVNKLNKQSFDLEFDQFHCTLNFVPLYSSQQTYVGIMVEWIDTTVIKKKSSIVASINQSQAVIEFTPKGIIKSANDQFLAGMGYELSELIGQHHSLFMPENEKNSPEYKTFWQRLEKGEFFQAEFKRIAKGNREIWLSASYNPLFDKHGNVTSVIKFATDITENKRQTIDFIGQIEAINRSQAVIEFEMDGTIRIANDNFLSAAGYQLNEIVGKHHRIFMTKNDAKSDKYKALWDDLNKGIFFADEIKRVRKDGSIIWLQASYNPVFDDNGKPYKVVKYAANVTERKETIESIRKVINQLAAGDLTTNIDIDQQNELYSLGQALNSFIQNLLGIIEEMNEASVTIKNAATEIAKGNSDLSVRTEKQAASIEETASTMEELTSAVGENSKNANQANRLAVQASQVATKGGDVIEKVVTNMASITESSRKISDIISVIDGIAFQTNILALNAAVEAARAGEQGRGFAVVATEVRNLAQRSANAAKDIKELITDSVTKIEEGNGLVEESGGTMEQIVTSVTEVNKIMSQIDTASAEQAASISELGMAIKQMDDGTQQNAALVEEAAAASESMQGQAVQLSKIVSKFKS